MKDVRSFYQSYFLPNNSILLVMGDFPKEDMLQHLTDRFGSWQPGEYKERAPISAASLNDMNLRFVNKPDLTQVTIAIAQPGVDSGNADRHAYEIMNYILGGGSFSSRLMTVIRSEEGKTYGISSRCEFHSDFGIFWIRTFTRNEEVAKTYKSILSELKKFIDDGITDEELQKAKSYYLGALPLSLESPRSIARQVLNGFYNGLTLDEMRNKTVALDNVTREDVDRVAKGYLNAEEFVLTIVGDRKKTREYLQEIGKFKVVGYRTPLNSKQAKSHWIRREL